MNTKLKKLAGSAVLAGLFFTAASAQAVDLRSWDQKINDATRRFVVLPAFNSEAVLDKETQLVWERQPRGSSLPNWWHSNTWCRGTGTGGRYGWRLPTVDELTTLVNPAAVGSGGLFSGHPFLGTAQNTFWTSSVFSGGNTMVAVTLEPNSIGATRVYDIGAGGLRAWCVRGAGASD